MAAPIVAAVVVICGATHQIGGGCQSRDLNYTGWWSRIQSKAGRAGYSELCILMMTELLPCCIYTAQCSGQ